MRPIRFTIGNFVAASVNNIAQTQAVAANAYVVLNGSTVVNGVAVLDAARQVLITSSASDVGITFTVVGTTRDNRTISETFTGGATSAASLNSFLTVISIRANGATAGTIQAGTNSGADVLVPLDWYANPTNIQINAVVTGTITFQIDQTLDDIFSGTYPANWFALQASGAITIQKSTTLTATALRVKVTAFTAGAGNNVQFELVQAGGTTGS